LSVSTGVSRTSARARPNAARARTS
jgi:hypothetical protein